jgi:hypothetical protein
MKKQIQPLHSIEAFMFGYITRLLESDPRKHWTGALVIDQRPESHSIFLSLPNGYVVKVTINLVA